MIIDRSNPFVKAELHPYADGELTPQNAIFRRVVVTKDNEVYADGQPVTTTAIASAQKWVDGLKQAFELAGMQTKIVNDGASDEGEAVEEVLPCGHPINCFCYDAQGQQACWACEEKKPLFDAIQTAIDALDQHMVGVAVKVLTTAIKPG